MLTFPFFLFQLTLFCLVLPIAGPRVNDLQRDREPLEFVCNILCMCVFHLLIYFSGKKVVSHSQQFVAPSRSSEPMVGSVGCPFPGLHALSTPFFLLFPVSPSPWGARLPTFGPLPGYKHLFQPVISQVVDFYQPTCIVLQVMLFATPPQEGFPGLEEGDGGSISSPKW